MSQFPSHKVLRHLSFFFFCIIVHSVGGASGEEPTCQCRRTNDEGSIPGSGRSPGGGLGNPLQYSCLESPMDRGAWQVTIHKVTESLAPLKRLSTHT